MGVSFHSLSLFVNILCRRALVGVSFYQLWLFVVNYMSACTSRRVILSSRLGPIMTYVLDWWSKTNKLLKLSLRIVR